MSKYTVEQIEKALIDSGGFDMRLIWLKACR